MDATTSRCTAAEPVLEALLRSGAGFCERRILVLRDHACARYLRSPARTADPGDAAHSCTSAFSLHPFSSSCSPILAFLAIMAVAVLPYSQVAWHTLHKEPPNPKPCTLTRIHKGAGGRGRDPEGRVRGPSPCHAPQGDGLRRSAAFALR